MHKVTKIVTDDGSCFDSEKEARKYIDINYGKHLTKIVHRLLAQDDYISLCEFLDANLNLFQELIELKNELNGTIGATRSRR